MKRFLIAIILIVAIYFIGKNVFYKIFPDENNLPASLIMSGININKIQETIESHFKSNLSTEDALKIDSKGFEFNTRYVDINNDNEKDLVVISKNEETCGSGGCLTAVFLRENSGTFSPVNFLYALKEIEILNTYTKGMRDLKINNTNTMVWNGNTYELETI